MKILQKHQLAPSVFLFVFSRVLDAAVQLQIESLRRHLAGAGITAVAGYGNLTVFHEPSLSSTDPLDGLISAFSADDRGSTTFYRYALPVVYGGEMGPDLPEVARHCGLSEEAVIARHANTPYPVFLVGFQPGFPYLGGLDRSLHTPRRKSPRTAVPAGAVGIGGKQTGVYPFVSPGGWQLIGRTAAVLFDQVPLVSPGDQLVFVPVDRLSVDITREVIG